jgi:hypothetical protein
MVLEPSPRPPASSPPRSLRSRLDAVDPFLGPQLAVGSALLLDLLLPGRLTIGPAWLLPGVEGVLLIGLAAAAPHPRAKRSAGRRRVALGLTGIVSLVNGVSLVLLCHYLLHGRDHNGRSLILSGALLWVTNVLLFGVWYWQLDRGGPLARAAEGTRPAEAEDHPDFLFPQMTAQQWAPPGWEPGMVDYLYVSFTNATAFSPTDTMPLTPGAKLLMAGQSLVALVTVGLVVARAVNIL